MKQHENDPYLGDLYLAGERVAPGDYEEIKSGRRIHQDADDFLPASLDGKVACYVSWGRAPASVGGKQRRKKSAARAAAEARNEQDDSQLRSSASRSNASLS